MVVEEKEDMKTNTTKMVKDTKWKKHEFTHTTL